MGFGFCMTAGDDDGDGIGVGVALTAKSLFFQRSLLPFLTQVYLIAADLINWPAFLHGLPGFGAAVAVGGFNTRTKHVIAKKIAGRFMFSRIALRQYK